METDSEKLNDIKNAEYNEDTLFKSVLKTSLRTLFLFLLFSAVVASYLCLQFPYKTMNIYRELSMPKSALAHCERAIRVSTDKRLTECLISGVELSDQLLADTKNAKYAHKLIFFTQKYAADPNFTATNRQLDDFYYDEILRYLSLSASLSLDNLLSLFSYKDYIYSLNAHARLVTNQSQSMLLNGTLKPQNDITKTDFDSLSVLDKAIFFNQAAYNCPNNISEIILQSAPEFLVQAYAETNLISMLFLLKSARNIAGIIGENATAPFTLNEKTIDQQYAEKSLLLLYI